MLMATPLCKTNETENATCCSDDSSGDSVAVKQALMPGILTAVCQHCGRAAQGTGTALWHIQPPPPHLQFSGRGPSCFVWALETSTKHQNGKQRCHLTCCKLCTHLGQGTFCKHRWHEAQKLLVANLCSAGMACRHYAAALEKRLCPNYYTAPASTDRYVTYSLLSPRFLWPVQGCKYRQLGLEPALQHKRTKRYI